ncbi:MAG: substrate-binding domain-containing protein [Bacteroidetes bacterium]|nr:substrate-binding domain-containing protein [Bacteroidota bacterium]
MLHRFLPFLLLLILASCNQSASTKAEQKRKFVIGFSQCNTAEPWRDAMNKLMVAEAAKHTDMELLISDAQQDNARQVADMENFIQKEVDLIMISPNEAQPLTAVVEKAFKAGIPVLVIDRKVLTDQYTSFIGANNFNIGVAAGKYAAKLLNGKGNIVEIWGLKGSTPAQERHDGFAKGLEGNPEIKIIYDQDGAWLREKGKEIMENALQRFEKIDLVYAHNDPMAIGAYLAAENVKRNKEIHFLGIDGLSGPEGGIQAVANGQLDATFLYPTGGDIAIQTAHKTLMGEKVEKYIELETSTIGKDDSAQ